MLHWWVWYTSITVDLPLYLCRHACCTSSPPVIKRGPTISYVNKDCTRQCARPLVQRENSYCFSSYVLQSHNCNSPLMRVLSVEFLISSHLRCASLSAYGYRLCGDRQEIHSLHTNAYSSNFIFLKQSSYLLNMYIISPGSSANTL